MEITTQLLLFLILAVILNYIPFIGKFVKVYNTLIHESGHALMSMISSGEVMSVDLFYSGEGRATTKSVSWISKFLVSVSGYFFSSLVAFLFCWFISREHALFTLYFVLSAAIINLLFWVRNKYGIIWLIVQILLISSVFYFHWNQAAYYLSLFITAVVWVDAFVSSAIILYISISTPKHAGDAKNLQSFTHLPSVLWGLVFFVQALIFALLSVHLFHPLSFVSTAIHSLPLLK